MKRTIQIEVDADADRCNGCRLRMIDGLGMSCAAFGRVALVETAHASDWLRCAACIAGELYSATVGRTYNEYFAQHDHCTGGPMPKRKQRAALVGGTATVRVYPVIEQAVQGGIDYGWMRAHKHTDNPEEWQIKDEIQRGVMNNLCEALDFHDDVDSGS